MKILESPLKRWQRQMSAGDRRREVLEMLEEVGMTPPDYTHGELHSVKRFREDDSHEYWSSPQLEGGPDDNQLFGEADD